MAASSNHLTRAMTVVQQSTMFSLLMLVLTAQAVISVQASLQAEPCQPLQLPAVGFHSPDTGHETMQLQHGCNRLPDPQAWPSPSQLMLTSNLDLVAASSTAPNAAANSSSSSSGSALSASVLDLGYAAARLVLQPGASLTLEGLVIVGAVMPPPPQHQAAHSGGGAAGAGAGSEASGQGAPAGDPIAAMIAAVTAAEDKPWRQWLQPLLPSFAIVQPGAGVRLQRCVVVTLCDTLQQYIDAADGGTGDGHEDRAAGLFRDSQVVSGLLSLSKRPA